MLRISFALLVIVLAASACDYNSGSVRESDPAGSGASQTTGEPAQTKAGQTTGTQTAAGDPRGVPATNPATATGAASASTAQEDQDDPRLYGRWVARDVDASMGEVKVQLTFRRDGPVRILAWSDLPLVGKVRDKRAAYEIKGNTLQSDALRGGTSVDYRFDGGDLIIEYKEGKSVRFKRQS